MPARWAFTNGSLLPTTPATQQAALVLVQIHGKDRHVLKLSPTKCTKHATALARPCFCVGGGFFSRSLCPVNVFWRNATSATLPGSPPAPPLLKSDVNRILNAAFTKEGIAGGGRYTAHAFRRGAASEILRSGSSLATIMRSGGWNPGG